MIRKNTLFTEEEFNTLYEQSYLREDYWNIGLNVFDRLTDIIYDDDEERKEWRNHFAIWFKNEFEDDATLEIDVVKDRVRKSLWMLISYMRRTPRNQ